ncbi:MAG: hypothetical protein J2P17_17940 [Mycobacterium sp.]|nr:hypothetical protein [Mycobacterium sp.]
MLFIVGVALLLYVISNVLRGRRESGAEVELAVNRRPYLSDQELESKKLDRVLRMAFLGIGIIAIVLPLYWLHEPSRQKNATHAFDQKFAQLGEEQFAPAANGGLGCADCHGGLKATGGTTQYTMTDASGRFVKSVTWKVPALNTLMLRFNRAEIRYILVYGRPFSPMPAWGAAGGGPQTKQQIETLIDYIQSIQIGPKAAHQEVTQGVKTEMDAAKKAGHPYASEGQALFNLGYYSNVAGGAFSCGRCHTQGWSYSDATVGDTTGSHDDGNGAMGPNLTNGDTLRQFPGAVIGLQQQVDFVCQGSEDGKQYGIHGQGTGRMPAFCQTKKYDPSTDDLAVQLNVPTQQQGNPGSGMMTRDQVQAIVQYERGL